MTEFGVQLHGTFPMGRYPELARLVEEYPFTELTVHDVVWWRPVWPILTLVAAATERVLVGPDVTHPYLRHPADTACNIAALDELSGGRAVLGLGAGSLLEPLGIESRRPVVAVRECASVVRHLLSGGGSTLDGEVFPLTAAARLRWSPPRAHIPMFIGAMSPKMTASAAAWADELRSPGVCAPGFFVHVKTRAELVAAEQGNSRFRVGCDVWLSLGDDRDEARALGRRTLAQFLPLPQTLPMREYYEISDDEVERVRALIATGDHAAAGREISDRTLDCFVAAGDAADVTAAVEELLEVRPASVTFSGSLGPNPERALELLGGQVLQNLLR